jgi:hypothetical protein
MAPQSERITRVTGQATEAQEGPAASAQREEDVSSWLDRYEKQMRAGGLSPMAWDVVRSDALYITQNCVFGAGRPGSDTANWPADRLRRGLVVGSVQSGKTASMLAVTAACLDQKVDVVVVLTGTRTALWLQTAERVLGQLDCWSPEDDSALRQRRVLVPAPPLIVRGRQGVELADLYHETPNFVRRQLARGRPLISIVMKQGDHLMRFGSFLRDVLTRTLARLDRPIHLLLIDDEADDGSILDAVVESGLGPDSEELKQIPRHIAQVWAGSGPNNRTFDERLYATYIAYTATPQANVLQADHNPLAPTDFVAALRTPLDSGDVTPRSPTFEEPLGLHSYYTGGEVFYRRLSEDPGRLVEPVPFPDRADFPTKQAFSEEVEARRHEMLGDAMRAYLVAASSTLLVSGRRASAVRGAEPADLGHIRELSPSPISMLAHPSSRQDDHFRMAEMIAAWSLGLDLNTFDPATLARDAHGLPELSVAGLVERLVNEEDEWRQWVGRYEATRERLMFWPGGDASPPVPIARWDEVKRLLVEEVFPHVRLTVINSDPQADDRPQFEPRAVDGGRYIAPVDIFTIFVSGNVMSRGMTIEGLVTSLFLRGANRPAADTQMQMQRWFGYRGSYLRWCRVILFGDQLDLLRQYHEADEAMRTEIIGEMNRSESGAPSPMVLQGVGFRATGKIANLRNLPLCPGSDPFVRVVDHTETAITNNCVLARLLDHESWRDVTVGGTIRGRAMERQLSLVEVAEVLEQFRYPHHDPDPTLPQNDRWRSLASELGVDTPLFRPPAARAIQAVSPPSCPYSIAAYLRLWDAVLTRRARGLYPTDDRITPWSMIDLVKYRASAPRFFVGIRYGSAGVSSDPALADHGIVRMIRQTTDGVLNATWGSRNPGAGPDAYLGDQLFDYHVHGRTPPTVIPGEPLWRRRGEPGLLLFHVLKPEVPGESDGVAVGLALPLGGPDHFAALRPPFMV